MTESSQAEPGDEDQRAALDTIADDYPGWQAWPGVVRPLLYARRPRSSPPLVVRAGDPDGLRAAIEAAERERGIR